MANTTKAEMKKLVEGEFFVVNGVVHKASTDADYCGVADYDDKYVVYDENGEGWFEDDFPDEARSLDDELYCDNDDLSSFFDNLQ